MTLYNNSLTVKLSNYTNKLLLYKNQESKFKKKLGTFFLNKKAWSIAYLVNQSTHSL